MITLEQFNEEMMKELETEFDEMFNLIEIQANVSERLRLKDFITQKLAAHKELILRMVREKAPRTTDFAYTSNKKCKNCNGTWKKDQCDCHGRNIGIGEFLNNLNTI